MTKSEKIKILFLCTGNSCRSQMAQACLRVWGGDRFEVYSAGLEPHGIHPHTIRAMEETCYDMNGHRSKHLDEYKGKMNFYFLITVCSNAEERCPYFPGMSTRMHWHFEDPAAFEGPEEEKLALFRQVRDQIKARIQSWLDEQGYQQE